MSNRMKGTAMGDLLKRRAGVALPVLGAVALVGASVPATGVLAGEPDGVDADAGRDAEAASGAAARHASDPRVQLRELFGLDASPGRIAELMVEGHHDPTSPWLMTPEEAAQVEGQLASQERLSAVQGDLRAGLGAAFAGVSIDQTDHGRITVKVAGDVEAAAVVALVHGLVPTAGAVDVERVDYGLDELEALAASVDSEADIDGFVGAYVDEEANRVELGVTGLGEAATVRDVFGEDDRLAIVEVDRVEPMAAMDPGDGIRRNGTNPQGGHECSIAFGVRGDATRPGNYAVTARHCTDTGTQWRTKVGDPDFIVGNHINPAPIHSVLPQYSDVAFIKLANNVKVRNSTKFIDQLQLTGPTTSAAPVGTVACKWGASTGLSCGTVATVRQLALVGWNGLSGGVWYTWPVGEANSVVYSDPNANTIANGDSGGLVFSLGTNDDAKVLGVVSGKNAGSNTMYFTDWGSTVKDFGNHYAFANG